MNGRQFFYEFGKLIYKIDGFYAEYAKESGVKGNLLWLLYALSDGESHSQREICDSWDLPRSTINTIAKELENDEYIILTQIKGKSRELNIELTKKGKKYADEILKDLFELEKKAFEIIKNSDVLEKMNDILNALYESKKDNEKSSF